MYKYYAFYVKIHASGVAPCVNPSDSSSRTLMESTFDEVGSLIKIYSDGYNNYYLEKLQSGPVRESNPGPLAPLSENHATRPTGQ